MTLQPLDFATTQLYIDLSGDASAMDAKKLPLPDLRFAAFANAP